MSAIGLQINEIFGREEQIVKIETLLKTPNQIVFCSTPIREEKRATQIEKNWSTHLTEIRRLFPAGYELSVVQKSTRLIATNNRNTKQQTGIFVSRCTTAKLVQIVAMYKQPVSTPPSIVRSQQHQHAKTRKSAQAPLPRSMAS